ALGLILMTAQAFFYNAIFFTYAMVLGRFFDVPPEKVGVYLVPFALSNFFGPLLLGRLFDTWGRKPMIALTYALSGLLLGATELWLGIAAERRALEDVARPLSCVDEDSPIAM